MEVINDTFFLSERIYRGRTVFGILLPQILYPRGFDGSGVSTVFVMWRYGSNTAGGEATRYVCQ